LSGPVRAEVEEDGGVAVLHSRLALDDRGLDELVGVPAGVGVGDGLSTPEAAS